MDGILVIDKPSGPTSHDICQQAKRLFKAKKVGHAGTLDPLATGVLILLIGQATKMAQQFSGAKKEYLFTMELGKVSDTYDIQGKVQPGGPIPPDWQKQLQSLIPEFIGEITQTTPPYSAVKHNGVPLYKLARAGKEVPVKLRQVTIESMEIVPLLCKEGEGGGRVTMQVSCSAGTYVRSIAHDLGQKLGCGAIVTELRRLKSEPFRVEDAIPWPPPPNFSFTTEVGPC